MLIVDGDGRLAGIITDGDVRRHMSHGLLTRRVEEVMTSTPAFISPKSLLPAALEIMETQAISVVPVVDEARRPLGLVYCF